MLFCTDPKATVRFQQFSFAPEVVSLLHRMLLVDYSRSMDTLSWHCTEVDKASLPLKVRRVPPS
jgi:hypothetical protein